MTPNPTWDDECKICLRRQVREQQAEIARLTKLQEDFTESLGVNELSDAKQLFDNVSTHCDQLQVKVEEYEKALAACDRAFEHMAERRISLPLWAAELVADAQRKIAAIFSVKPPEPTPEPPAEPLASSVESKRDSEASAVRHAYVSMACQHGKHDECRIQCKFCESRCACTCGHPNAWCSIHHYRHGECEPAALSKGVPNTNSSEPLVAYLTRQWEWSKQTFGPGRRTLGVTKHIEKEIAEVRAKPDDLSEWIDIIILAMDGYWRHGGRPESLLAEMQAKQDKNFARQWPASTSEDEAVEHDRTEEPAALPKDVKPAGDSSEPSSEASYSDLYVTDLCSDIAALRSQVEAQKGEIVALTLNIVTLEKVIFPERLRRIRETVSDLRNASSINYYKLAITHALAAIDRITGAVEP